MQERTGIRNVASDDPELFPCFPRQRVPETLTVLDVSARNRHGAGRKGLREPALLGQHLMVPDQHQRHAREPRIVVHARAILSFDRTLVQPAFARRYGRRVASARA